MKSKLFLATFLVLVPLVGAAADKSTPPAKSTEAPKRHPLRGVVMGVIADKSALLVKHEEVPGVMHAMTMMFKVDAGTLKSAKEGQAITGMLARESDGWWLHDVKVVSGSKK